MIEIYDYAPHGVPIRAVLVSNEFRFSEFSANWLMNGHNTNQNMWV